MGVCVCVFVGVWCVWVCVCVSVCVWEYNKLNRFNCVCALFSFVYLGFFPFCFVSTYE